MADVLREYLIGLGWSIDQAGLRRFNDALHNMAAQVEKYTASQGSGIGPMFVKAGVAVATTLAGITAGALALADTVATSDLSFQVYARRMFMAADAARSLKIAQDALGYSLEDIIMGPPELRERFGGLVSLQGRLTGMLGGDFEGNMRKIRDLRFEVTKLGVEFKYLGMSVVNNLARTLLGSDDEVRNKIMRFNEELLQKLPQISGIIATSLAPILREMGTLAEQFVKFLTDPVNITAWTMAIQDIYVRFKLLWGFLQSPSLDKLFGQGTTSGLLYGDHPPPAAGSVDLAGKNQLNHFWSEGGFVPKTNLGQMQLWAQEAAKNAGIDPALFMGLIGHESGFQPFAVNPKSGAFGPGQLMSGNMNAFGLNGQDPEQNLEIAARLLAQYLKESKGDIGMALKSYGGFRSQETIQNEFPGYYGDVMKRSQQFGPQFQPQSYHPNGPTVNVYVTHTNATADDIGWAVQRRLIQNGGVYA